MKASVARRITARCKRAAKAAIKAHRAEDRRYYEAGGPTLATPGFPRRAMQAHMARTEKAQHKAWALADLAWALGLREAGEIAHAGGCGYADSEAW